jgi:hypothetical protein
VTKRNVQWRQGSVLNDTDADKIPASEGFPRKKVVLITHDCDLASSKEEIAEYIVGSEVNSPGKLFTKAKHQRQLHLAYQDRKGLHRYIELTYKTRGTVSKTVLHSFEGPDEDYKLIADERRTLSQWLAARYGRPAFPENFEARLRREIKGVQFNKALTNLVKQYSTDILAIFLDLGDQRFLELEPTEIYGIKLYVVYVALGAAAVRTSAKMLASEITKIANLYYPEESDVEAIDFETCAAIADNEITLSDLRKLDQWQFEYLSLDESPTGDFISSGSGKVH